MADAGVEQCVEHVYRESNHEKERDKEQDDALRDGIIGGFDAFDEELAFAPRSGNLKYVELRAGFVRLVLKAPDDVSNAVQQLGGVLFYVCHYLISSWLAVKDRQPNNKNFIVKPPRVSNAIFQKISPPPQNNRCEPTGLARLVSLSLLPRSECPVVANFRIHPGFFAVFVVVISTG
jgi:hypothetical protein